MKFEMPTVEVKKFNVEDILTTSSETPSETKGDPVYECETDWEMT